MLRPICSAALLVCAFGACDNHVYLVDSLVTESGNRFDPALLGSWVSDSAERVVVRAAEDSAYLVEHTGRGGVTIMYAALAQLGGHTILELRQASGIESGWPGTGLLLVVRSVGEELTTSYLRADSLRGALARGDTPLSSLQKNDDIILTDATSRLGPALTHHLGRPGVLDGTRVWRRQRP